MLKALIFDFNRTLYDPENLTLFPGVLEVLSELSKELTLGLITTYNPDRNNELFVKLKINDFFNLIKIVEEKNKQVFLDFCNQWSLSPTEVGVVGDLADDEIAIGKSLGMTTFLLDRKKHDSLRVGQNYQICSLAQIKEKKEELYGN